MPVHKLQKHFTVQTLFLRYHLTSQHSPGREAAEALKARNIPAQGKRAEGARRPGDIAIYDCVPRPLRLQSASPTGGEGAMELAFLACHAAPLHAAPLHGAIREGGMYQWLRHRRNHW